MFLFVTVTTLLTAIANGKLKNNPNFEEVDCSLLPTENYCNTQSNGWCIWKQNAAECVDNYNPILFISSFDIAAMSRSLISFTLLASCIILYWFSGLLVKRLKIFKDIESDKLDKCQIYIFELLGLTYAFAYLLYENTFNMIVNPDEYTNLGPQQSLNIVRSLSSLVFLMYLVCVL